MTRNQTRSLTFNLATLALLLALNQMTEACPHLLCHPLEIENAQSLSWHGEALAMFDHDCLAANYQQNLQAPTQGPLFNPAPGSPVAVGEGSGKVVPADVNKVTAMPEWN